MPRIMKKPDEAQDIRPYDFFAGFQIERTVTAEEPEGEEEEDGGAEEDKKEEQEEKFATELANEIISEAEKRQSRFLPTPAVRRTSFVRRHFATDMRKDVRPEPGTPTRNSASSWIRRSASCRPTLRT